MVTRTAFEEFLQASLNRHQPSSYVGLRMAGEFTPDTFAALLKTSNGILLVLAEANKEPICEQLLKSRRKDKGLTIDSASKKLTFRESEILEENGKLAALWAESESLSFSTEQNSSIYFPNLSIIFRISNRSEFREVGFNSPDPSADRVAFSGVEGVSQPQILDWVKQLMAFLGRDHSQH